MLHYWLTGWLAVLTYLPSSTNTDININIIVMLIVHKSKNDVIAIAPPATSQVLNSRAVPYKQQQQQKNQQKRRRKKQENISIEWPINME